MATEEMADRGRPPTATRRGGARGQGPAGGGGATHRSRRSAAAPRLARALLPPLATLAALLALVSLPLHEARVERLRPRLVPPVLARASAGPLVLRERVVGQRDFALILRAASATAALSTEQRVAQLFFVTPEALLAGRLDGTVVAAGQLTREALLERPVGGLVYFQQNLVDAAQTKDMLAATKEYALEACGIPILLDVDEEGGSVSRVGGNEGFAIENVGNMSAVGQRGDAAHAGQVAARIGSYLRELGFTADFAPVADVANNPSSDTMSLRSFGPDAGLVSQMVAAQVEGFSSEGVICCVKHFPGIGGAEGDSHDGAIYSHKSAEEMVGEELLPFSAAIEAGVPMVMVGHLSCPELTGSDLPASLSPEVMGELLRGRLGFAGVIVTDSLGMGAVSGRYGDGRVGVEAFLAGADALLMPADFDTAYQGMLDAVASGEISERRLYESAFRIVYMKLRFEEAAVR